MDHLKPGVMLWAGHDPADTLADFTVLGIRDFQLGIPGDVPLPGLAAAWKSALSDANCTIHTVFMAYVGESYADIASVEATVGFVSPKTRSAREARSHAVIDFAEELGAPGIATHIGCLPADPSDREYQGVLELVRRIADHASPMTFALETGQESAAALLAFLESAARPNLGINFDPANMVLYGSGDPLDALSTLAPHVLTAHAKDGTGPAAPGTLGSETALGDGSVNVPAFLTKLRDSGYKKPVFIEREASDPAARHRDIALAIDRWPSWC